MSKTSVDESTLIIKNNRSLGGMPLSSLRRVVIDKMIRAGGWVVNDYERQIGGRRTFIVLAQTPASNDGRTPAQTWTYYFTELDSRVYSLATTAPSESSDHITAQSEQVLSSFQLAGRSILAASPQH